MNNHHNEFDRAIADLGPHDHLCMVFDSRSDQFAAAIPFIQSGLARGERCLYIIVANFLAETKAALAAAGIDLDRAVNSGALALLNNEEVYYQEGAFDPQQMISRLTELADNAVRDGFSALRVTGEMTRVLGDKIGLDRFIKYESAVNDFLKRRPVSALCLYDRARFEPEVILDIIRAHPKIIYGREIFENHFYISPSYFGKKKQADREIKILISMLQSQKKREQELERKESELTQKEILLQLLSDEKRDLQDRFQSITQHAFNMEYLRAPDGRLLYISPSCERITGYTPDQFLANPVLITEMIHPEDQTILKTHQCSSRRLKRRKEENEAEFRIIHQDGRIRWIHHTCQTIKDGRGRVIGQRGSNTDITALKEAELSLKESEGRFRRLAENAPDLIYHYQIIPERKFTYVSPAATAITGFTPEEHYADPDLGFKIVHPDDRHILAKAADGKQAENPTTLRWVRKDGTVIWTEQHNVNVFDNEGRLIAIEGIARDITERKKAEVTLAGNLDLLRMAGDYAQFGGWSVDLETNVCTWSDAVADIHEMPRGFSPKVDQGINFYAPEHRARITQVYTDCAVKGIPYNEELQIITSSGKRVWVRTIGEAVRDEHGKIVKVQGSFENIDDRKKAEAEILAHNERLRVIAEILQFNPPAIQEFLDFALENALKLTGSRIGYIYFYDEARQLFTLNTWSKEVMDVCSIQDAQREYQLEKTGIWGEAVRQRKPIIVNDFHAPNALKKGYPEGHAPLNKFLTIPVMNQNRIVAVIGVANKTEDYTDADVLQLSLLMDSVWKVVEQRQAAQALRESEEKYRSLFEQSADGIFLHDLDGQILEVNHQACRQSGYSQNELLNLTIFDLHPKSSPKNLPRDMVIRTWGEWQTGETKYFEAEHQHKDGTSYPVEISSIVIRLGERKLILALVKDITHRRQAENALRESEKRFRFVFESANVGKSITSVSGLISANRAYAEMLGYSREEINQKTWQMLTPPEDIAKIQALLDQLLRGEQDSLRFTKRYIRKDGSLIWADVSTALLRDEAGNPQHFITTILDITEQRRVSEAEREMAHRIDAGLRAGNLAWWEMELPSGRVTFDNRKAEMLGYSPKKFATFEDFTRLLHPEDHPRAMQAMRDHLEGRREYYEVEYRIKNKSGKYNWFRDIGALAEDGSDNNIRRIIGIVEDITLRKYAELELERYSDQLEQLVAERTAELEKTQQELIIREKLATLGQLAGGVGHELRNPLGVISNAVYILKAMTPPENEKAAEYIQMISDQVQRSNKIISDLLNFAREPGVNKRDISMSDVIRQALSMTPIADKITVESRISEDLPLVNADQQHLEQILANLISNACQAMPQGGKLSIHAGHSKNQVKISVTDQGTGISPKNLGKLFTPLFTTKTRGIGLGLATSKKLAEANGGSIKVKSEEGKGSTFTLILPVDS